MRTLLISIACMFSLATAAATPSDSLLIRFGAKGKILLSAPTKRELSSILKYDLNQIVRDMLTKLDSVPEGQVYTMDAPDDKRYQRDTVMVVRKNKGTVTVTISKQGTDSTKNEVDKTEREYRVASENKARNNWRVSTDIHVGLNTWVGGNAGQVYSGGSYELNPLGSRYIALSLTQNPAIARTNQFKLSIRYGLQVAWNNFMFQENVRLERVGDDIAFAQYPTPLRKSKLTVAQLEIPFVPQFAFYSRSGRKAFNLGIGGYVGYRIGSYTKVKQENGDKFRDHNSFLLNTFQYGIQANLGLARFNFFIKYSLTPSFQPGNGPEVRPLSFGITI